MRALLCLILTLLLPCLLQAENALPYTPTLSFPNAEVLSENTVRIPFTLADHLILLYASVEGTEGNLILDTGASHLILNEHHFKNTTGRSAALRAESLTGTLHELNQTHISTLAFSSFKLKETAAHLLDLSHLENEKKVRLLGVLGYEVLKDFEIFIDFHLKQITLYRTRSSGEPEDKHLQLEKPTDSISFDLRGHSIVLRTRVNGQWLRMGLDTGAEINFLDKRVPQTVLQNFKVIKRIRMHGMNKGKVEVLAGKLYALSLNPSLHWGCLPAILGDLRGMKTTYGTSLDGVLGYDFIAQKRIAINYRKRKLFFVTLPGQTGS